MGYIGFHKHPTIKTGERKNIRGREMVYYPATGWMPVKMTEHEKVMRKLRDIECQIRYRR